MLLAGLLLVADARLHQPSLAASAASNLHVSRLEIGASCASNNLAVIDTHGDCEEAAVQLSLASTAGTTGTNWQDKVPPGCYWEEKSGTVGLWFNPNLDSTAAEAAAYEDRPLCRSAQGSAGSSGDPHLVRLDGSSFDLFEDGTHDLLRVPSATAGQLRVTATIKKLMNGPNSHFTTELGISGTATSQAVRISATPWGVTTGDKFKPFDDLAVGKIASGPVSGIRCAKHDPRALCFNTAKPGEVISIDAGEVTILARFNDFPAKGFLDVKVVTNAALADVGGLLAPLDGKAVAKGTSAAAIDKEITDAQGRAMIRTDKEANDVIA